MKKYFITALVSSLIFITLFAQEGKKKALTTANYEQATKALSFNTGKLVFRNEVNPNWMDDDKFWYSVSTPDGMEFVLINAADGNRKTGVDKKTILPDATEKAPTPSQGGRRNFSNEVISPDGKKAAFIKDWNLWIRDLATKQETALTTDGVKDFGYATDNAGWKNSDRAIILWSPDSKKIATFQQDQRNVSDIITKCSASGICWYF